METRIEEEEKTEVAAPAEAPRHCDRGLLAIGSFKLVEAVFFFLVGIGAIHFLHHDLGDAAQRLAVRLRMDLDGRVMTWVLDHLDDITSHRLKQIGIATFFYAGLRIVEGVGLVMEALWAEYLTVGATTIFLPWEVYEIVHKPDWMRIGLLLTNLVVLAYLTWSLKKRLADRKRCG